MHRPVRKAATIGGMDAEQAAEISLVPLVDLCLTLVVVFLILMPMALTTDLPIMTGRGAKSGAGEEAAAVETPLLIELTENGVRIDGAAFPSDLQAAGHMRDAYNSRKNHDAILRAADAVTQDRLVHWLDLLRTVGPWIVTLPVASGGGQ